MTTIFVKKEGNYTFHGRIYAEGGSCETADNRWSYKLAIREEKRLLPIGTEYQIEQEGKIIERGIKEGR